MPAAVRAAAAGVVAAGEAAPAGSAEPRLGVLRLPGPVPGLVLGPGTPGSGPVPEWGVGPGPVGGAGLGPVGRGGPLMEGCCCYWKGYKNTH